MAQATEDKNTAVAQAERTAAKAKLADRLINGLSSEFARWTATIEQFAVAEGKLRLDETCTALMHSACWVKVHATCPPVQAGTPHAVVSSVHAQDPLI